MEDKGSLERGSCKGKERKGTGRKMARTASGSIAQTGRIKALPITLHVYVSGRSIRRIGQ